MTISFDKTRSLVFRVAREYPASRRLDVYLHGRWPLFSRTLWQKLIKAGAVLVNGRVAKASTDVHRDDRIEAVVPVIEDDRVKPEAIPLNVIYEDENVIVINKPPGMVVHPARGHRGGTVANALLHHCGHLSGVGGVYKPGIVHRLDKDTTGVLLGARNDRAHRHLGLQFEKRQVEKEYLTVVAGDLRFDSDVIDRAIGRHVHDRKLMAVRDDGRHAESFYEVLERFGRFTYLKIAPKTGRTHQIRVHLHSM